MKNEWEISKKGIIYKWAYLIDRTFGPPTTPSSTNLCSLVWRSLLWTPFALLLAGVASAAIGVSIWSFPWIWLGVVGGILLLIFFLFMGVGAQIYASDSKMCKAAFKSIVTKKKKFCPIIHID